MKVDSTYNKGQFWQGTSCGFILGLALIAVALVVFAPDSTAAGVGSLSDETQYSELVSQ